MLLRATKIEDEPIEFQSNAQEGWEFTLDQFRSTRRIQINGPPLSKEETDIST